MSSPALRSLDAQPWQAGCSLAPFGTPVGVRLNDPSHLGRVLELLSVPCDAEAGTEVAALLSLWVGAPSRWRTLRNYHHLFDHSKRVVRSLDLDEALRDLRRRFHVHVALTAPATLYPVHAGVVEWRGRALLLPGMLSTGKSRLLAALLERGAGYVSDTFAMLDARGRVHPYPTSLVLWDGTPPVTPRSVGTPLPVGWVADVHFDPQASTHLEPAGWARTARALFEACVTRLMRPDPTMRVAGRVAERAMGFAGTRGDAAEAADRLLREIDRPREAEEEAP